MLFDPERHEPCVATPWSEDVARDAIARIVRDAEDAFVDGRGWPLHPRDPALHDDAPADPLHALYDGSCGVVWALHGLRARGAATLARDYAGFVAALPGLDRRRFEREPGERPSYLVGETSMLMLRHALRPDAAVLDEIAALVDANQDNPACELLWGAPGTMLAAAFLHEREGGTRWADLFRRGARVLEARLERSDEFACETWPQQLWGRRSHYLDAVHGFAGTASVLVRGRALLGADAWARWQARIEQAIRATAIVEDGCATWPTELGESPARWKRLMQHCHGAPGFVTCLAELPGTALDDLLLAAGEATWRAGPLRKGANLCHGTGGNGYAFLKLHARTGDARWLERARAFAMHALAQREADTRAFGRSHHSLWTGDLGLAIYLDDCVRERAAFPTLDTFFFD